MKKDIIVLLLATMALSATNVSNKAEVIEAEPVIDSYSKPDVAKNSDSKDRSNYMPRLITPENLKSGIYGGFGLGAAALGFNTSPSILSSKNGNNKMLDLSVIAGYNYNKYLAVEARTKVSAAYDNGLDVTGASIFFKPKYEIYKNVDLYSLVGYGVVKAKQVNSNDTNGKSSGAQIGIGANYNMGKNFKVFADYLYLGKDSNAKYNSVKSIMKSSAITGGITYDF